MSDELMRVLSALLSPVRGAAEAEFESARSTQEAAVQAGITHIIGLIEERAGLRTATNAHNAPYRLRSRRLDTIAPDARRSALEKKLSDYNIALTSSLPEVLKVLVMRAITKDELAREHQHTRRVEEAQAYRAWIGVYAETVHALDILYNEHRIGRWHWLAATEQRSGEKLRKIAAILGQPNEGVVQGQALGDA